MTLTSGDRIGSYEIVSRLGAGGMGVVYRAHDSKLERDVAIKVLSAKGATDSDRLRRFEQEARAASALDHPNIITIHEIGETDDGQPYIVMQLVDGKSLRELIDARRLGLNETLRIATQIADGLARAHREGIIHRDLKPDNVMVTDDGLVKILDFGLAKLAEPVVDSELATIDRAKPQTAEGRIVGTAHYMSPEQAEGESVDARSDIFSFGALLYEMITGKRAFQGNSTIAVLSEVVQKDPERVSSVDRSLPVDLDKIVQRALRKDPARRFQNISDVKVALAELTDELESGDALTASDVRAVSRKQRRWWPKAALAALAVGVALYLRWPPPPELPPMRVVPLTTDAGDEEEPALSHDGRQLAFVKNGHIYVKLIDEGEAVQLTSGDVSDASPAWSPDGTRVAFLRHHGDPPIKHQVLEVPAVGGNPKTLGQADGRGHVISYSPDGTQLAITHRKGPGTRDGLFLLSRETGERRRLTTPDPSIRQSNDRFPKFSPDGRYIAFMRVEGSIVGTGRVYVYDLAEETERLLQSEAGALRSLDFTPDGKHVVYSVGQTLEGFHLATTPVDGGESRAIIPGERATHPSASRSGNRLVYVRNLADTNIWRVGGPGAPQPSPPERIVASTLSDSEPQLSPDGSKLAFVSGRSGTWEIWTAEPDGSNPNKLTSIGGATGPRWSPDGTRIAFASAGITDAVYDIFVIDADGGFPINLTRDAIRDLFPCWSADGRYIYYETSRQPREIWRVAADGGQPEPMVPDGHYPKTSAEGDLFFNRNNVISRWHGPDVQPTPFIRYIGWLNWYPWRDKIVFKNVDRNDGNRASIDVFDIVSGTTTTLLANDEVRDISSLTVSSDGQWIYYDRFDTTGSDIMLVENFVP